MIKSLNAPDFGMQINEFILKEIKMNSKRMFTEISFRVEKKGKQIGRFLKKIMVPS